MSALRPHPLQTSQHRKSTMSVTAGADGARIFVIGEGIREPICDACVAEPGWPLQFPNAPAAYRAMCAAASLWADFTASLNYGASR